VSPEEIVDGEPKAVISLLQVIHNFYNNENQPDNVNCGSKIVDTVDELHTEISFTKYFHFLNCCRQVLLTVETKSISIYLLGAKKPPKDTLGSTYGIFQVI